MTDADPLDRDHVRARDPEGRLGEILDLGEHLRDGLWRVASANPAPEPTPGGLQLIAVDGLGVGGTAAREAMTPGLAAPLTVWEHLPTTAPGLPVTAIFASYSGADAPVLDAFARLRRARRVVLTTGGALAEAARADGVPVVPLPGGFPEPRLAVGYSLVTCLEFARLGGLSTLGADTVEAAAVHVVRLARAWGPDGPADSPVKRLARHRAAGEPDAWAPSPVEAGETPLEKVVTRLLLEHLLDLYAGVLAQP